MIDPQPIIEQLFPNLEDVNAYAKRLAEEGCTDEEVELLNPDKIDTQKFWKIAAKLDNISTCGGGLVKSNEEVDDIIRYNYRLADYMGLTHYIDKFVAKNSNILEIGSGFGPMRYLKNEYNYGGSDVVPRQPDVRELDYNGFSEEFIANNLGKFNCIFSCNVFQHISDAQKQNYLKQTYKLLQNNGLAMFAFSTRGNRNHIKHKTKDEQYTITCGQLVRVCGTQEFLDWCYDNNLQMLYLNSRSDNFCLFVLIKRESVDEIK